MKLEEYFDYIEEHLNFLSLRIERRATLNLHDINIKAEYFFMHFLNMLSLRKVVENENIQFVASILKDKLPTELQNPKYYIVELSEHDKLFKF